MQTDPILMVSLIRQCNAGTETAELLLHWLKQAVLLDVQRHGRALSASLVRNLMTEFGPILQALASLSDDPPQQAACQQLFSQICAFYRDLNPACGDTGPEQPTVAMPPVAIPASGFAIVAGSKDTPPEQKGLAGPPSYNRYD
ncbi:hypothetical protein EOE67_16290 [Rheinheimera riviphila]|uniref:Uncharacterized protein n=1 Tax=Rheinheimera riviphila TaxID=1834037 RepID=A0A437QGA2_9GAMM|nr:hypothetical protein [Rheinheimera riviphila]RVU33575.1 hypothetical protein EOE67_16290 [Rheinheimera riviphila]